MGDYVNMEDGMLPPGKELRLSRIFRRGTGEIVIVALDHGRRHGPIRGIEDFKRTVSQVLEADIDTIMATPAMIGRVSDLVAGRVATIAGIDGTGTVASTPRTTGS